MTWDNAYKLAEKYYKEHGNLLVPSGYIEEGFRLHAWILKQRYRYSLSHRPDNEENAGQTGKEKPLTQEQITRLEAIGMVWKAGNYAWERSFAVAEAYYKEHGNLLVPTNYCRDGVNLSSWIRTQRQIRNGTLANRKSPMSEEQIRRLDSIGMPWQPYDSMWERSFSVAEKYYHEHGNLSVPKHYEENGVNLSHWIWAQRRAYAGTGPDTAKKLTEDQIKRLEEIGMVWAPRSKGFSYYYQIAERFYKEYGHTDFPDGEIIINGELLPESGGKLAEWKQQMLNANPNFEHLKLLRKIGIVPAGKLSPWEKNYRAAEDYYHKNGHLLVPFSYINEEHIRLGRWISTQRMKRNGTAANALTEEQIAKLDAIGMVWNVNNQK